MLYALAVVLVLILDQWLKYWVTVNIALNTGSQELIPGIVSLVNIHNSGAAYGILNSGNWRWAFVAIAVVFTVFAVVALKKGFIKHALGRWAMVGVLAGAIGNCIDRVLYGYVVDMFKLEFMDYAIFNVADMFISCCGILFCLYIIFSGEGRKKRPAEDDSGGDEPVRQGGRAASSGRGRSGKRQERHGGEGAHGRAQGAAAPRFERAGDDARTYTPRKRGADTDAPAEEPVRPAAPAAETRETPSEVSGPKAPEAPRGQAAPGGEDFSLEDILAEFGSK